MNSHLLAYFQQLSQFWYDDATTEKLVEIALKSVEPSGKIALISCPTLYKRMKYLAGTKHEGKIKFPFFQNIKEFCFQLHYLNMIKDFLSMVRTIYSMIIKLHQKFQGKSPIIMIQ